MTTSARTIKPSTNGAKPVKDDDVLVIDLNHLTIAEIETVEEIIDAPIDAVQDPKIRKGKVLRAIAYVMKKRENPDFTLEDAGNTRVMFSVDPIPPTGSVTS